MAATVMSRKDEKRLQKKTDLAAAQFGVFRRTGSANSYNSPVYFPNGKKPAPDKSLWPLFPGCRSRSGGGHIPTITTIAGTGEYGFDGDDGLAINAKLYFRMESP